MALHDLRRRKLTYEDYLLIPEDGQRHEILDGEHYVTPAPFLHRIYRRQGERLAPAAEISPEGVLATPLLPGLQIPLAEVFA
jgi:hypothetical protein